MTSREMKIAELLRRVGNDANSAAELLTLAAEYLQAGEQMPTALADHIAKALSRAALAYRDERVSQLGYYLGLTVRGASSKKVSLHAVAVAVAGNEAESETQLKKRLSKAHGVSESTALKHIKRAKSANDRTREILAGFDKLVVRNPYEIDWSD